MCPSQERRITELNLTSYLSFKGHAYSIELGDRGGPVQFVFTLNTDLLRDIADFMSGAPERRLLQIRSQIYQEMRSAKAGGRPW